MADKIQVIQHNYDMDIDSKIYLELVAGEIVIDCVGGTDTIHIKREQFPQLCGLLFKEIMKDCNER